MQWLGAQQAIEYTSQVNHNLAMQLRTSNMQGKYSRF